MAKTEERKHALLSASGAHRWLNCTPSARLEEHFPDESSVYAEEGTLAHELAELELKRGLELLKKADYEKQLADIQSHALYTSDMPEQVGKYVTYVMEQFAEAKSRSSGPHIFLEQRLDFSRWVPEGFGTGDCTIISSGVLEIIDFKYGKGVEVEAEENEQMMLYGLGALEAYGFIYDVPTVRMTIHQPRLDSISSWEITADDLLTWADQVLQPKAQLAWEGSGQGVAGDWCRFCKIKARCVARAEASQAIPNAFNFRNPSLLGIDEIASILHKVDEIQAWAKDVQDFALAQARDHGVKFAGWKLVEGRSNRRYTDQKAVEKTLVKAKYRKKDIFKAPELIGIISMEKLLGKKKFAELLDTLVDKPPGKPTLVPESDKRPELNSAANDFDFDI